MHDSEAINLERDWRRILECHKESNFLQSPCWAETNNQIGHHAVFNILDNRSAYLSIVKDAKRGRYLEIPGGPLLDWHDEKAIEKVFRHIVSNAKSHKCVFVRFRPQFEKTPENEKIIQEIPKLVKGLDLRPAPMHLHAQNTVIIDLTKSEDELLANMRRQTRYEVRRAEKLGLKVTEINGAEALQEFHVVQAETAKRQNFIPPSLKELLAERSAFVRPESNSVLYKVTNSNDEAIAYGLILIYGPEAEYFEAASTDLNRKLPGSTALLWQAMKDLKKMGIERFNLWGIAPPGVQNHRYSGVTTFKTGFGGRVVEYIPAQDIVINKVRYKFDEMVENARKKKRNL